MTEIPLQREFVKFRIRSDRPAFIGNRFGKYLKGKVLDVGCDEAVLQELLGKDRYSGIGMTKESAVRVDLEKTGRLPFHDNSWDTILCLDVLEHLNNLYEMCDEIFRVAKENIIISLPNCWSQARRSLAKGSGAIWHYGLPPTPPPDRHKWFFNTEDALHFFHQQAVSRPSIEMVELVVLENHRPMINRIWRRLKYPSRMQYLNLYPNTVVCVFRKSQN
ncbi:class I SAM-dependent methyltransferase [bacterium]|nr:class I SAM-dependent methyltransferase [bacterium]